MSQHRQGVENIRDLPFPFVLDQLVKPDSPARVIDMLVNTMEIETFGFNHVRPNCMGAPCYDPRIMLKIYFYGYLTGIRSSRKLAKACEVNVEVMWMTDFQTPSYHAISTFRTYTHTDEETGQVIDHCASLKLVFKSFVKLCQKMDLVEGKTVGIDGTKMRTQNGRKKNFTQGTIDKKLAICEKDLEKYKSELAENDAAEAANAPLPHDKEEVRIAILEAIKRQEKYTGLDEALQEIRKESPEVTQISITDPDARSLVVNNVGHAEVGYNVQTAVDNLHSLIVHFEVENRLDNQLMGQVAVNTKEALGVDTLNVLLDKGYHVGEQFAICEANNIVTYVAVPEPAYSGKDSQFTKDKFNYNAESDTYICPAGEELKSNGTNYQKKNRNGEDTNKYQNYICPFNICGNCKFADKCLSKSSVENRHGRTIERSEFQEEVDRNNVRVKANKKLYARRQAIVEHPYGTIKRQRGVTYTLLKRKRKVTAEFAIVFTAYNLTRVMNILGVEALLELLKPTICFLKVAFFKPTQQLLKKSQTEVLFLPKPWKRGCHNAVAA
jgi:transposase